MKQYLLTSVIDDKLSYKKKVTSDRITYEYYPKEKMDKSSKQHAIPYAKQIAIGMLIILLFLVN